MTDRILSEITPLYGFCPFSSVKDNLIQCRALSRVPRNAQTVIVCLFPYFLGKDNYNGSDISKYAVVPDYHDVVIPLLEDACKKLKAVYPDEEFEAFADNSPIPEVRAAVNADLGVRGKNGLLINEEYGSWVFIGEIITTKKFYFPTVENTECIGCGKCIIACPTGSISENGIDKASCLSDITQRKGELKEEQIKLIRDSECIWGCDICQNACPMNLNVKISPLNAFKDDVRLKADAENIDGRAYAWRGRKTIERNINILYKLKGEEK